MIPLKTKTGRFAAYALACGYADVYVKDEVWIARDSHVPIYNVYSKNDGTIYYCSFNLLKNARRYAAQRAKEIKLC